MLEQRTRIAWFAPKTVGWGVRPVTWQGWLATIALLGATLADLHYLGKGPLGIAVGLVALAVFAVVVRVGGSAPD